MLAGIVALGILALFYVPFVREPMFARTFAYLTDGRLGGEALFHNSLTNVWRMSTFYNSLYYLVMLALGIGLLLVWKVPRRVHGI